MGQVIRRLVVIVVVVGVLLGGLAVANQVALSATDGALADHVKRSTKAASTTVSIPWFPFGWNAAVDGTVDRITVTARNVPVGPLTFSSVQVRATGVHFDRNVLFDAHSVKLTSVDQATVTGVLDLSGMESGIASELGLRLVLVGPTSIAVEKDKSRLYTVNLADNPLIPHCNLALVRLGQGYQVSCHVAPVPASVLASLSA